MEKVAVSNIANVGMGAGVGIYFNLV